MNETTFPLVAFGWHEKRGYGAEVTIPPGEARLVYGPYLGKMGDGDCWVDIPGNIICHEEPDTEGRFEVSRGLRFVARSGHLGLNVRHHEDPRGINDEVYNEYLAAGPVENMRQFPFGIDPQLPPPGSGPMDVEVEGHGSFHFPDPGESIISLAGQVVALGTGEVIIVRNADHYLTVLSWDDRTRQLKVKLN